MAHRGYALRYPENTLPALEAALREGATCVEFDVQLTADGVPVLLHDADLKRTGGVEGRVTEMPLSRLREVGVGETQRLGGSFPAVRVPTLAEAVELLGRHPKARAFVELKRASIRRFGAVAVVGAVIEALQPILPRCVVISFDDRALEVARDRGPRIGWVLEQFDAQTLERARALRPEYLLADKEILPEGEPLWPGPWSWVVYDAATVHEALLLAARGAQYVETMAIGELRRDPGLAAGAGGDA